jgi:hypothetical protein
MRLEQDRVVVTLDRDFSDFYLTSPRPLIGVVYLDLPNRLRHNSDIIRTFV